MVSWWKRFVKLLYLSESIVGRQELFRPGGLFSHKRPLLKKSDQMDFEDGTGEMASFGDFEKLGTLRFGWKLILKIEMEVAYIVYCSCF